jgi:peptide/nickel transport system substrate-binding protein
MKKLHIRPAAVLILSILILLTACSPADTPSSDSNNAGSNTDNEDVSSSDSTPKILKVRITRDIRDLDPAFITGAIEDMVDRAVMEGLIRYLPDGSTENQLVESLTLSDDGLQIHFKLREGILWQRGYGELTTEDVRFSYERFIDPDLAAAYADDFLALDHVEIIDKYEGIIVLKEPQATLFTTTLPMTSGLIVSKAYFEAVGLEQVKTDIVGTGPYLFTEWKPNEKVVLTRNPEYWGAQPYYDEIHIFPISEDAAAEVALQANEIDFSTISLASADRFQADASFDVEILPTNSYNWIGLNVENPKLQDINVRQAIRYGIDVPSILAAAYDGKAEQARALIAPNNVGYWEDAPLYSRDVEKAKEYLALAGLTSLDLELSINDISEHRIWAEIAQQNLAEVGINLTIVPLDSASFWELGAGDKGLEVELFTMGYSAQSDPAWFSMWFTCDQVGVWNWMRWCSPEFDQLHKQGITTLDTAEREKFYLEMQQLWDDAVISVWITDSPKVYVSTPDVTPAYYPGALCPMLRDFTSGE